MYELNPRYSKRIRQIVDMLTDPDLNFTRRESIAFVRNWTRFEMALARKAKAQRKLDKYTPRLNADLDAYELRKSMKDL